MPRRVNGRIQALRILLYCLRRNGRDCVGKGLFLKCYWELRKQLPSAIPSIKVETLLRALRSLAEEGRLVQRPRHGLYCADASSVEAALRSLGLLLPELELLREGS